MILAIKLLKKGLREVKKEISIDTNYLKDNMLGNMSLGAKWAKKRIKDNNKLKKDLEDAINILSNSL